MNNRIIYMSETEIKVIRNNLIRNQDVFVAEIAGELVKTEKDYVQSMINAFKFPFKLTQMKIGWCNDYLYDLSWIKEKIIILIVYNFKQMLTDEEEKKSNIVKDYEEILLPWWEKDVVGHMVGGTTREFIIYFQI